MLLALIGFVIGSCTNIVYVAAIGTVIPISVWFYDLYNSYKQQKIMESKLSKLKEIEESMGKEKEVTLGMIKEVKDCLSWTIL